MNEPRQEDLRTLYTCLLNDWLHYEAIDLNFFRSKYELQYDGLVATVPIYQEFFTEKNSKGVEISGYFKFKLFNFASKKYWKRVE